jgi:hypothetical protein
MELISAIKAKKHETVHAQGHFVGGTACGTKLRGVEFIWDIPTKQITCKRCQERLERERRTS